MGRTKGYKKLKYKYLRVWFEKIALLYEESIPF